jgi:exopolyphosphatase/guanosine-5'-triphosphate,3'-diphosphate pyrophosphatase
MIRASIDIGSNSVLLLVAEINVESKRIVKEILNLSYITSLGKDLDLTKKFHDDSMKATYAALLDYKNQLLKLGIDPKTVLVTATEASRVATNAPEFYRKIKNELGFSVRLITAANEALYTALGVISEVISNESELVIMDVGGASTELMRIQVSPFKIVSTISLPVGSVRATDWRQNGTFDEKMKILLAQDFSHYLTQTLICVAGSMTSLAAMFMGHETYNDKKIDGLEIDFSMFKNFSENLQNISVANLIHQFPHLGKRAPMVSSGAKVAVMIGEKLNIKNMKISTRGLRYGTLIQGEIDGQFAFE